MPTTTQREKQIVVSLWRCVKNKMGVFNSTTCFTCPIILD